MLFIVNNNTVLINQSCSIYQSMQLSSTMFRLAVLFVLTISGCYAEELKAEARDSYIDAYQEYREPVVQNVLSNQNDRESKYSQYYDNSGPGQFYGPPHHGYPEPSYPPSNYGPPIYGPPNHVPRYRAFPTPFYGVPHAMMGLLDKLHLKLNIYTVLKIILKLVIFKKIVGFIAIICLLLFIPKFKMSKDEDEMDDLDSRSFLNEKSQVDARLNTLTQYVLGAIEKYSDKSNSTSKEVNSTTEKIFRDIDIKFSYQRLLTMYANEDS